MKHTSNNALWASAFVLLGMILFTARSHTPTATAATAITGNGYTLVTSRDGRGTELVYVVDDQRGVLMVYDVQNPQGDSYLHPVVAKPLGSLFSENRK